MSGGPDPSAAVALPAPLSTKAKTVRNRMERERAAYAGPERTARFGEAWSAVQNRIAAMFKHFGEGLIPAGRKAQRCGKCGEPAFEHGKGRKVTDHPALSVAPSMRMFGRTAKAFPGALLRQAGARWEVVEPATGFVRGRGTSRRAAMRAALRAAP